MPFRLIVSRILFSFPVSVRSQSQDRTYIHDSAPAAFRQGVLIRAVDAGIRRSANVTPALVINFTATMVVVVAVILAPGTCEETEVIGAS